MKPHVPFYATEHGKAYLADALDFMPTMADSTVSLIFTSPPYALHFKKEYGNVNQGDYIAWFLKFARHYHRLLRDDGSFVLDIGGAWKPGQPTRSLYHFELLIALCKEVGFHLAQEFFWYNPGKLPSPAEWVNVRKIRVKDAVECVWWLSKTPWPKANNQQVLNEYSPDMKRLLEKGYKTESQTQRAYHHEEVPGSRREHTVEHIHMRQQRRQRALPGAVQGRGDQAPPGPVPTPVAIVLRQVSDQSRGPGPGPVRREQHDRPGV